MVLSTKNELRAQYLEKRKRLELSGRKRDSASIHRRILRHAAWKEAGAVLSYVSYGSEVDTHPLIAQALEQHKRVIIPLASPDGNETLLSELRRFSDLSPGRYKNILEPKASFRKLVAPSEVELALVPGLVFDRQGGRIGSGIGYFDRLLPKMTNALRWGVAFSIQIHPAPLSLDAYDVRMQAIVTETEMIETGLIY